MNTELRLAFYGDDFTGSTDALEVLAFAGLRCALFLSPPTPERLASLGGFDAIGVAGDSRGMTPEEMSAELPGVFAALASLRPAILHYKICSTFDSSPSIGSIGKVLELATGGLTSQPVPIVGGTPALKRFCAFGNLFARSGTDGNIYRIDRHPIMSAHPVTPMSEGDLKRHLALQTDLAIASLQLPELEGTREELDAAWNELVASDSAAVLIDATTSQHLTEIGRLLEELATRSRPIFAIGPSGVEYALTQWWRQNGSLPRASTRYDCIEPVKQILAISGSASPLSATQIDTAVAAGFADIAIDAASLVSPERWEATAADIVTQAASALHQGDSVVMHTARGPRDDRIAAMLKSFTREGLSIDQARHVGGRLLGQRLGHITRSVLQQVPLERVVLSGGDTSSQVTQVVAPDALEVHGRLAPGAPLCRVISDRADIGDLQLALKGGQMGDKGFFVLARDGNGQ